MENGSQCCMVDSLSTLCFTGVCWSCFCGHISSYNMAVRYVLQTHSAFTKCSYTYMRLVFCLTFCNTSQNLNHIVCVCKSLQMFLYCTPVLSPPLSPLHSLPLPSSPLISPPVHSSPLLLSIIPSTPLPHIKDFIPFLNAFFFHAGIFSLLIAAYFWFVVIFYGIITGLLAISNNKFNSGTHKKGLCAYALKSEYQYVSIF